MNKDQLKQAYDEIKHSPSWAMFSAWLTERIGELDLQAKFESDNVLQFLVREQHIGARHNLTSLLSEFEDHVKSKLEESHD